MYTIVFLDQTDGEPKVRINLTEKEAIDLVIGRHLTQFDYYILYIKDGLICQLKGPDDPHPFAIRS